MNTIKHNILVIPSILMCEYFVSHFHAKSVNSENAESNTKNIYKMDINTDVILEG